MLADIDSKRRILDHYTQVRDHVETDLYGEPREAYVLAVGAVERVIRLLALPFDSHPEYRKEWRP